MAEHKIIVTGRGMDKHELVEIDILSLPARIRKIYGIAKDKREINFFKRMGFKREAKNIYAFYPEK